MSLQIVLYVFSVQSGGWGEVMVHHTERLGECCHLREGMCSECHSVLGHSMWNVLTAGILWFICRHSAICLWAFCDLSVGVHWFICRHSVVYVSLPTSILDAVSGFSVSILYRLQKLPIKEFCGMPLKCKLFLNVESKRLFTKDN